MSKKTNELILDRYEDMILERFSYRRQAAKNADSIAALRQEVAELNKERDSGVEAFRAKAVKVEKASTPGSDLATETIVKLNDIILSLEKDLNEALLSKGALQSQLIDTRSASIVPFRKDVPDSLLELYKAGLDAGKNSGYDYKVRAVKEVRNILNCTLREAKDLIDKA